MVNETGNAYEAPTSEVISEIGADGIGNFKRFSAWGVLGLSIITLGIYPIYWLYTRANTINEFHSTKISVVVINAFILLVLASTGASIAIEFYPDNEILNILNAVSSLAYFVSYLVLLFTIRNRLREITKKSINPVLTFFGTAIYFQYKINQTIDEEGS